MEIMTIDYALQKARELLAKIGEKRYLEIVGKLEAYFANGKTYDNLVQDTGDNYITGIVILTQEGLDLLSALEISQDEFVTCYRLSSFTRTFKKVGLLP